MNLKILNPKKYVLDRPSGICYTGGKYWEVHDRLFATSKAPKFEDLALIARAAGLDAEAFRQCLDSGKYASEISKDIAEGRRAGVRGVPTFLVGFTQSEGSVKAVKIIRGARPYSAFKEAIESLLASKNQ